MEAGALCTLEAMGSTGECPIIRRCQVLLNVENLKMAFAPLPLYRGSSTPVLQAGDVPLWVRFSAEARGKLHLWAGDSHVLGMRVTAAPEKQVFLPVPHRILSSHPETITLTFHGSG